MNTRSCLLLFTCLFACLQQMADLVTDSMDIEEYISFSKLRKVNYCECTHCSSGDRSYTELCRPNT